MQRKIGVREKKFYKWGVRYPKSLGNPGLNNGLHNVPVRIEPGQSSLAPQPFNNNDKLNVGFINHN